MATRKAKTRPKQITTDVRDMPALQAGLIQAIEQSGMSLYEIAERSGVAYMVLHRMARGQTDPRLSTVDAVAKVIGITWKSQ